MTLPSKYSDNLRKHRRNSNTEYTPSSTEYTLSFNIPSLHFPLQVTDSSQRWSYLQRKTSRRQSLCAWLLFSNSDRLYSGSKSPVTCPLYPSTPFHCYTLCKVHISVLPSYAELKIPRLSLPCNVQIWQLYFVRV
jgi:hypothetical protein